MKKILLILLSLGFLHQSILADDCSDRYRSKVFSQVKLTSGIYFTTSIMPGGAPRDLYYDVYEPLGDTASLRPLVVLWHGGAFIDIFNRNSPDIVAIARELAQRGYVVISSSYRGIKNLGSFLNQRDMIQAVVRAVLDGNSAACHIFDGIENGNPYRIDKNQVFGGGVSAGSVLGMHGLFLNSVDEMPENYRPWVRAVDNGAADAAFANKFCGGKVKGFINISGAILDTSFIQPSDIAFLHIHGTADFIVPFDKGRPLGGLPTVPELCGSKPIHEKSLQVNVDSEIKVWEGRGHVPFLNLDLPDLLTLNLINTEIFEATIQDISNFLFERIECEPARVVSSISNISTQALSVFPNPTNSAFNIRMPAEGQWLLEVTDVAGRLVSSELFTGNLYQSGTALVCNNGLYMLRVTDVNGSNTQYTGKLIISR